MDKITIRYINIKFINALEDFMNYFQQANEFYNAKDYKKAISMYEKALELNEHEASSLYNTAVCHIKLKNFAEAINKLISALRQREDSKYFFNLAYCYVMMNNNKKALIYFNKAWALNPKDEDCEKAIQLILKNYIYKA